MSKYLKLLLGINLILFGLFGTLVKTSAAQVASPGTEYHAYSYVIKKDGSASVWLRIDELRADINGITYSLELPKGTLKGAEVWYRENGGGCVYPMEAGVEATTIEKGVSNDAMYPNNVMYPCNIEGTEWKKLEVKQSENKLSVTIPKLKKINNQNEKTLSLGMIWKMENIANKKWWGREINIETAKSDNFISYENVAVDVPIGVYLRDKQTGPANWGEIMANKAMMSETASGLDSQQFSPTMFDMIGGGQIMKDKSNISPGENFSFTLMSATSMWKLYIKEIGMMLIGIVVLILVAALLLRLIIGKKPLGWYIAVTFLIIILVIIVTWMITMYKSIFYADPPFKAL